MNFEVGEIGIELFVEIFIFDVDFVVLVFVGFEQFVVVVVILIVLWYEDVGIVGVDGVGIVQVVDCVDVGNEVFGFVNGWIQVGYLVVDYVFIQEQVQVIGYIEVGGYVVV